MADTIETDLADAADLIRQLRARLEGVSDREARLLSAARQIARDLRNTNKLSDGRLYDALVEALEGYKDV